MEPMYKKEHYNCKREILTPPQKFIKCNSSDNYKERISVDACLADEIRHLWEQGIRTTGCCCGHGIMLGFIEVVEDDIAKMENMGYVHYIYEPEFGGADRKDAFIPKNYGHIYDSYYVPEVVAHYIPK